MPHKPRRLVGGRVRFLLEVEHPMCPGCPGWKAHPNKMSMTGWQHLPPLYCTTGPGGWKLQVPVGGLGGQPG